MKHVGASCVDERSRLDIIVHNLNGPLTAIHGFAWLAKQSPLSPQLLGYLRQIQIAADRLQGMIREILTAADAATPERVNWSAFWTTCVDGIRAACARHDIRLDDNASFVATLDLVPEAMRQVFENLTSNSIRAIARRGGDGAA